jgi:S1-C subfamily serine protease
MMKNRFIFLTVVCALLPLSGPSVLAAGNAPGFDRSVVKVFSNAAPPDFFNPWQTQGSESRSGSGVVIAGNRILTNAHVVSYATFIEVKKSTSFKRYVARIEAVGHDCDLALLTVEDPSFFDDIPELAIGALSHLGDPVQVVGFPEGGDQIAVTEGVVSRIDIVPYAHSEHQFMAVQIDAAVNSGNSGGPVIQDGKLAGIAFQSLNDADNIGYMIPEPIITHFLKDLEDGRYDGFPEVGIWWNKLMNPSFRQHEGIEAHLNGLSLKHVVPDTKIAGLLRAGDVVLAIEGTTVGADATVPFRENARLLMTHLMDAKQVGEPLAMEILRDEKILNIEVPMQRARDLVPWKHFYERPPYYIYGGFVFTVLTEDLLQQFEDYNENLYLSELRFYSDGPGRYQLGVRENIVVLLRMLADDVNAGYSGVEVEVVADVNGKAIRSFREFVTALETSDEAFTVITTEQKSKVVFNRDAAKAAEPRILQKYQIPASYSADVAEWVETRTGG